MLRLLTVMGVAGLMLVAANTAQARPNYLAAFKKAYTDVAKNNKVNCFVCHEKNDAGKLDKKKRNNFGQALGKALGKKNVKSASDVTAALKKAEGEKSAVEGKTFGDLLKDGKLPASKE